MRPEMNPPAIVCEQAESFGQLVETAKNMQAEIAGADRMNLSRAVKLGNILNRIQAMCEHGQWLATLEKMGVKQQNASDYQRIAKLRAHVLSGCKSIREALRCAADEDYAAQPPPPPAPPTTNGTPELKRCRPCRVNGAKPGCKDCAALNATREPGDDTEEEVAKPANVDSHGRKKKAPHKPAPPREAIQDKAGATVPDHLRDIFADTSLADLVEEIASVESETLAESWLKRAGSLTTHYGFILIEKVAEHTSEALHQLQLAKCALEAGAPYAVCPKCSGENSRTKDGKTCRACRGYGYVPEDRFKELTQ